MQQPIETLNWDSPLDKEFKRQKRAVADKICLHSKGYAEQQIIDSENDTIESYDVCNQCGRALSELDKIQIIINLKKFKQKI